MGKTTNKFNVDRHGNTSRAWGRTVRQSRALPRGYTITLHFPYGATSGEWPTSHANYFAQLGTPSKKDMTIATYTGANGYELADKAAQACIDHSMGKPVEQQVTRHISQAEKLRLHREGIKHDKAGRTAIALKEHLATRCASESVQPRPDVSEREDTHPEPVSLEREDDTPRCSNGCDAVTRIIVVTGEGDTKDKTVVRVKGVPYEDVVRFVRCVKGASK